MSSQRTRAFRPGRLASVALFMCAILVASGCEFDGAYDLPLPGKVVSKGEAITITGEFVDALNVVPRTEVLLDDVAVGQVSDVERKGWHAKVEMLVRDDLELPDNITLEVRQTSLLGEKYIAIVRPDRPEGELRDNKEIALADTGKNPEVEEVLGALSLVLGSGGVGQLRTISVELNKALEGRTSSAKSVVRELNKTVGSLNDQRQNIVTAMEAIDSLSTKLVKERSVVGNALTAMGPALAVLNEQHKALVKMLESLDELGAVGTRVVNGTKDDLLAILKHLGPILGSLADAEDDLAPGLSLLASYPFPKQAEDIAQGDYANAEFFIDLNLQRWAQDPSHGPRLPGIICALFEIKDCIDGSLPTPADTKTAQRIKQSRAAASGVNQQGSVSAESLTVSRPQSLTELLGGAA